MNASPQSTPPLLALSHSYVNAGFSVIPIKADGSKRPAVIQWKPYEKRQPTEEEIRKWFGNGADRGIAIIGGKVSGNLEVLDFDAPKLIAEWRELVEEAAPGLLARLPQVETPSGGLHVYYRCETIEGNKKLAEREIEVAKGTPGARQRDGRFFKVETMIETRGEGGYVVTAGSPAACHSSGKLYRLINGDLKAIPTVTERERDILLSCARSLNEFIKPAQQIAPETAARPAPGLKPGEDFNRRGDVRALLEKHGWKRLGKGRLGEKWQRPEGDHQSGTLFESGNFYVFSSNAYPLEPGCSYSPFALFATLEHNSDFQAAAKSLAAQGYGEKAKKADSGQKRPSLQIGDVRFVVKEEGAGAGIYACESPDDDKGTWICSQLKIEADTRDEYSKNWGRLLKWPDSDGVWHQWAMPAELLGGDGREYRTELLNQGLKISPSRRAATLLGLYLNTNPGKKALCVTKQGWHRNVFVLPDETIGESEEAIYLQTVSASHPFKQAGTTEEWRDQIGRFCAGNKRLVLAASIGFSAPLLNPLNGESGGWHFTGTTTEGKTTTLYAAGSIHGGGNDRGFLRGWRATINGLETVAETHHDALLCLDEIAECRPDDVNEAAYMLANGQGKARQGHRGGLRHTSTWRLSFLSSGETSIADHIAQTGKKVRGGQEVRIINLPANAGKGMGLFEELHGFANGDEFARYLQRASRDCYGAPIRAFIRNIAGNLTKLSKEYKTFEAELLVEMLPEGAASEVVRVAHRFALAAFAGEKATDYGITGWEPGEAADAAKSLFQVWLDGRGTVGSADEEAALRQVMRFIELHGQSRFQRLFKRVDSSGEQTSSEERTVINRAGYVEEADDEGLIYYALPEVFKSEICAGFNSEMVAKALVARGHLLTSHNLRYEKRFPEGKRKVYAIKSASFE